MFAAPGTGSDGTPRAKGKGPAWMGTGSGRGPRRPEPQWKPSAPKKLDPEARQRAIRALVAVTAAVLLGGFVYYLLTRPAPTPLVALRASPYPLQMPPLAFAEEDVELIQRVSPQNVRVMPVDFNSSATALEDFRKQLKAAGRQFNPFRRGSNAIVVHVAAHGVVNERGEPCLVPPAANPFSSETWLPLAELFQSLRSEPALEGKKKLVVLDCQRVFSCWRCGWLENDFAAELAAAVKAEDDANLYVISAAGPGQIAWAAPELRGSVFGHFLARGLRGEASGPRSSVSLAELFQYVAEQVAEYSQRRRGVRQQPTLWHRDREFTLDDRGRLVVAKTEPARLDNLTLAYIDRWERRKKLDDLLQKAPDPLKAAGQLLGDATPESASAARGATSASLRQVWQLYHTRRQAARAGDNESALPGYVYDPVVWSSIEQRLAAIGERLLAGQQYQGAALQAEIDKLAKDLGDEREWATNGTLPMLDWRQAAAAERAAGGDSQLEGRENLLEAYAKAEPDKRSSVVPPGTSQARLIGDICAALTKPSSTADALPRLATAIELLKLAPPGDGRIDLIESHFITLLSRGWPADQPLPAATLAAALRARQVSQQAVSPSDHRVHYVLESLVNAADEKRRDAEDLLFLATDSRRGETLWNEALGNPTSPGGYQAAIRRGERVAEFLRLRDEVWSDLPIVVEWHFVRARLGGESTAPLNLHEIFTEVVKLDASIEGVLQTRDDPRSLATHLAGCEEAYANLSRQWQNAGAELESVYNQPTNIEQAYRRPEDVRDAELALRFPPLAGSPGPFLERYRQTLDQWVAQGAAPANATSDSVAGESSAEIAVPTGSVPAADGNRYQFFQQLHRALAYEFVDPYGQHRPADAWDDKTQNADSIFRAGQGGREPAWQGARKLLDAYNEAIKSESPAWNASSRALAASANLRRWDRRVRVAGPWLCSFQPDLRKPTQSQSTPARWLQQYDAAHMTAWHAYRALGDFWGNGLSANAAAVPYFALAIEQCDTALPQPLRPIRYDIPGSGFTDFPEHAPPALQSLSLWEPVQFPKSFRVSGGSAANQIDVAVQPPGSTAGQLRLPSGVAALSFASPAEAASGSQRVTFDAAGQQRIQAVTLSPADREPRTFAAFAQPGTDGQPSAGSSPVNARLWFRGHVRSKPCPLGDFSQFVQYEFARPRYAAPTVEVRGKDTVRGAVLFVFDCSASMRATDGRFEQAKQSLKDVLARLQRDAASDLRVALMVYGRRTPADGEPPIYYRSNVHPDSANNLTDLGQLQQRNIGPPFVTQHPHPDRDVEDPLPVAGGSVEDVLREVDQLSFDKCRGCTPLYHAITKAVRSGFKAFPTGSSMARRVVVISDGVNMPYDSNDNVMGRVGTSVDSAARTALEAALANSNVQVSLILFGAQPNIPVLREKLADLEDIARANPNFTVRQSPRPADITNLILDSFPKTEIELRSAQPSATAVGATAQPLPFNQPQVVKDWGAGGLLRREPDRRAVRLKLPGEERTIEQDLDLIGGERVVLQFQARDAQLVFDDDGLTRRGSSTAESPRVADSRKLLFDALDPERVGRNISKFHFRIRDDDRERRFTPRPKYAWIEVKPRGASAAADHVFPCIDAAWKENVNLPRLQVPVERWPECPTARVQAWFRYSDPQFLHLSKVSRDQSGVTLPLAPDKWRIEQVGGDAGTERKITVIWQPSEPQPGIDKLLERAVWLHPAPDSTSRRFALDGSAAIHEFTFTRPEALNLDIEVKIATRAQFQQGAYFAEFEFDVAN